jgi:hypothetical protein
MLRGLSGLRLPGRYAWHTKSLPSWSLSLLSQQPLLLGQTWPLFVQDHVLRSDPLPPALTAISPHWVTLNELVCIYQ